MNSAPAEMEWSARDGLYLAAQCWPQILLFCLGGALLGLILAFALPSPYRATGELYVGLDIATLPNLSPTRKGQVGLGSASLNDIKNWQMASLNTLIFTDEILGETLQRLRQPVSAASASDPAWQSVDQQALAAMLHAYWRNAGKWRLAAEGPDARLAAQAVQTWQTVVVERVEAATSAAKRLPALEDHLQTTISEQAALPGKTAILFYVRDRLVNWLQVARSQPTDLPPETSERDMLVGLVAVLQTTAGPSAPFLTGSNPAQSAENDAKTGSGVVPGLKPPAEGAAHTEYIAWIEQALATLDQAILATQAEAQALQQAESLAQAEYAETIQASLGLSSGLLVQQINAAPPEVSPIRPVGLLVLIGCSLGLVAWILVWLAQAGRMQGKMRGSVQGRMPL